MRAERLLSVAELASTLGVQRYRLIEWVHQGLLPTPKVLGMRRDGRAKAYAYSEKQVPELQKLVAVLKARRVE
jgi:hypothetical protein